jgi:hypothetical protein
MFVYVKIALVAIPVGSVADGRELELDDVYVFVGWLV